MCGSGDLAQILCSFSNKLDKNHERTNSVLGSSLPAPSIPNRVPSKFRYGRRYCDGQRNEPNRLESS